MSADNGVYILQTKGPEFRVAYGQNVDAIYGKFNDVTLHWDGDPKAMRAFFDAGKLFTDIGAAWDYAEEVAQGHEYLEDGVCLISSFDEMEYPKGV